MKKTYFLNIVISIFFMCAMVCIQKAGAQTIPDSIFDKPPRAFGNTVQDVPPDILSVKITPESPTAGKKTLVSARIWVNPEISKFKVKEAYVYYRDAGAVTDLKRVSMGKSPDDPELWSALLPGFPGGTSVEYYIRAIDEINNEVVQLPITETAKPGDMIDILSDGEDEELPATMDIISVYAGYDGNNIVACPKMGRRFQQFSRLGADAVAMGFIADDVRNHPSRSITENTAGIVGYVPAINLQGILRFEDFERGNGGKREESSVKIEGRNVCLRTKLSALTTTPDHGLKIFCATLGMNALTKYIYFGDATPYAIIYFKGGRFTVAR
jgi:hypothetical protein